MKTVKKYSLSVTDEQQVNLPVGYKILNVGVEYGIIYLYVLIDTDTEEKESVNIFMCGTDHKYDTFTHEYISTVGVTANVYHIFKKGEKEKEKEKEKESGFSFGSR